MGDELAAANVNRTYSLAATSIAIFTFMLIFVHPRLATGEADATLFQATLLVMGLATFSFVFASFHYYGSSAGSTMEEAHRPGSPGGPIACGWSGTACCSWRRAWSWVGPAPRRGRRMVRPVAGLRAVRDPRLPRVRG